MKCTLHQAIKSGSVNKIKHSISNTARRKISRNARGTFSFFAFNIENNQSVNLPVYAGLRSFPLLNPSDARDYNRPGVLIRIFYA